jgi:hypothetical protein
MAAKIADWASVLSIGVFSAIRAAFPTPDEKPVGVLNSLHSDLAKWFVPLIILLSLTALTSKIFQEVLGSASKVRIKALLDALRDSYFSDVPGDERHHNRVTLFKADRNGTKLKPLCRSGTQFQRSAASFRISNEDEASNEGIAGRAWFIDATLTVNELPTPNEPWDDKHETCIAYAEAGRLPLQKAAKLKVKSRSLLATPVRSLSGAKWGVLVLDSRKPDSMVAERENLVSFVALAVGKMV